MSFNSFNLASEDDINMVTDPLGTMFDLNNNLDEVRGRSLDASTHRPRSPSLLLSKNEEEYHVCVQRESDRMNKDEPVNSLGNINLEYVTQSQNHQVNKVADFSSNMRLQCALIVGPTLNQPHGENVINIHLNYNPDKALDPESWDRNFHAVSLYGSIEHLASDALNIKESLTRMRKYIAGKSIDNNKANDAKDLNGMGKAIWEFISAVYDSYWDALYADDNNTTFRNKVKSKFSPQARNIQIPSNKGKEVVKPTFVSAILPPIPAKSPKEVKEIEKPTMNKSYAQALSSKLKSNTVSSNIAMNTLKIKKAFPNLPNKKIDTIQKVINSSSNKPKPRLNMTTKGSSHKQVIVPINNDLGKRFIKDSAVHVTNINHALKSIKSNVYTDFISADNKGIIIVTNNIASNSDLQKIEKYIKNSLQTTNNSIATPRLPQLKSYLKIVGIPYFVDKSNTCISSEDIECILKNNHIFNDIVLASKLRVIKVSSKSDMAIIWIDIWDTQNGNNAKKIINRQFNVGSIITMVRGANMNPGTPQCKNCWKWEHMAEVCHIQGLKCTKCNGLHLTDNHCDFAWCFKANDKLNPPRLETKKDKPCLHSFKCINCKGSHVADSVECPFWKHHFNKEWHSKEYAKLRKARRTSRITSLSISFLKLIKTLTSYSSKSHHEQLSEMFLALQMLKAPL